MRYVFEKIVDIAVKIVESIIITLKDWISCKIAHFLYTLKSFPLYSGEIFQISYVRNRAID